MNNEVKIQWLGHSCFRLEYRGSSLVSDPYADGSVPGLAPLRVSADAVFCSHGHGDHNAAGCVRLSGRPLAEDVSVEEYDIPHDHHGGAKRGMNKIRRFTFGSLRVVHMGDTGRMPEEPILAALRGCDALLLPVGGYYTVDAEEAYRIVEKIHPRVIVPMHYRGEGFGYDVISTLDAFTALCPAQDVHYLETDTFALTAEKPQGVVVPKL